MMASARMVLPGVLASMLLVAPAWAGDATAGVQPRPKASAHPAGQRARAFAVRARGLHPEAAPGDYGTDLLRDAVHWSAPHDGVSGDGDGVAGEPHAGAAQVGMASWYGGSRWHGGMTSSGERFDQDALTAAHATLPIGTMVRVSTLNGSGSVVVRITDRPGTRRRIIDLSRGAASALGILDRGIAMVSLQPL